MKNSTLASLILLSGEFAFSQVQLTPVVIGSAGNHSVAGNLMISSTVGELATTTISGGNFTLTQGFHQPSSLTAGSLLINTTFKKASCLTAHNGEATANVLNGSPPYTYTWSPEGGTEKTATGLVHGTYIVSVTDAMGHDGVDTVTIGVLAEDACDIHVYKGVTPNGDGKNDVWIIDGITIFPENEVSIFNRWGERVWHVTGYDNDTKVWKGKDATNDNLPDGTYFYILEITGVQTYKGWVQITR